MGLECPATLFKSGHGDHKDEREARRTSVNVLYTLISGHERLNVYNSIGERLSLEINMKIQKLVTDDKLVLDFLKDHNVPGAKMYQCSKLSVFSTEYKIDQFIVLPGSKNISPKFGRIKHLLCCQKYGYLVYQDTNSTYCENTDLFFITEGKEQRILPTYQLSIGNFRPLEGYLVGEQNLLSLSLRNYVLEHI